MGLFNIFKGKPNQQGHNDQYGAEALQRQTAAADKEIETLQKADEKFKADGNLDARIQVYERILNKRTNWNSFNQCMSLAEMYVKAGKHNMAWTYLNQVLIWFSDPQGPVGDLSKVRKLQFKILKSEGKNADAFSTLVLAYVLSAYTASGAVNFNKEKFIKEVKTTAKAMNLTDQTLTSFTDGLEKLLKRKRISEKEAQEYCAQFLKKNA